MLGPKQEAQGALFYEFSIEGHVPQDHLLRSIDRFVDLSGIRHHLAPFYSNTGRPSIDAHSGVIRPPIPIASGHPYRFNPATQTGASGHP